MNTPRKNTITIVGTAIGYLLFETVLFVLGKRVGMPEMMLLVSTAGMLAGFLYSGRPSTKRAMLTVGVVLISPLILLISWLIVVPSLLLFTATTTFFPTSLAYENFAFLVGVLSGPVALFFIVKRFRHPDLQTEAAQWLADRYLHGATEQRRRSRIKRWSLWLPSLSVLLLLIFWAPVHGAVTRPRNRWISNLPGYHFSIPIAWIPRPEFQRDAGYVNLVRFGNMLPAALTLGQRAPTLSLTSLDCTVEPDPDHDPGRLLERARRSGRDITVHVVPTALAGTVCWEYKTEGPSYYSGDLWSATCAKHGSYEARFLGDRTDLESFYQIVSSAKVRK